MNLRLTHQIILLVLTSVVLSAIAILATASTSVSVELTRQQQNQTSRMIRALAERLVDPKTGSITSDGDTVTRVVMPTLSDVDKAAAVDDVGKNAGGHVTIFAIDSDANTFMRIATTIRNDQGKRVTGTPLAADSPAQPFIRKGEPFMGPTTLFGHRYYAIYQPTFDASGHVNGILFAGSPMEGLYDASYHNIMVQLVIVSLGLAILIALAVTALARRLFEPLRAIARRVEILSSGDLTSPVPAMRRSDEIGQVARAIDAFRRDAIATLDLRKDQEDARQLRDRERTARESAAAEEIRLSEIAVNALGNGLRLLSSGDLMHKVDIALYPAAERLRHDLNGASNKLRETMVNVANRTRTIDARTLEIAQAADSLARRTEEQAAHLEETATTLNMITDRVRSMAANAGDAAGIAATARLAAQASGDIVEQAVGAMDKINSSSAKIGNIIHVIDEIAFQTNLLALNAGVEAARAGEAGRGFAVVASEVRSLAQRSAEAAKEIKDLIQESTVQVQNGVGLVAKTGASLKGILVEVSEMDLLVREISASARDQASGLADINVRVGHMDKVVQQNAAMVEESTAAAHALQSDTKSLTTAIAIFQLGHDSSDLRTPRGEAGLWQPKKRARA